MTTVYLNIGSNQGDRHALIEQAVALIAEAFPQARVRRSEYIESAPWGFDSPYPFLNLGLALDFDQAVEPFDTFAILQDIERTISTRPHRHADGSYADREIDIDFIALDDVRITTPHLVLPHPRAHLRDFVTIPMSQLKQ